MSKAFTKEDDDAPVEPARPRGIPVPVPNFVTATGLRAARAELDQLGRAGGNADRIRELTAHVETAQVAPIGDRDVVGLGATVVIEDGSGKRSTYRIVGAIEADVKRGWLGWQSPVASALWSSRVGDVVELPRGGEAEIILISYDSDTL